MATSEPHKHSFSLQISCLYCYCYLNTGVFSVKWTATCSIRITNPVKIINTMSDSGLDFNIKHRFPDLNNVLFFLVFWVHVQTRDTTQRWYWDVFACGSRKILGYSGTVPFEGEGSTRPSLGHNAGTSPSLDPVAAAHVVTMSLYNTYNTVRGS